MRLGLGTPISPQHSTITIPQLKPMPQSKSMVRLLVPMIIGKRMDINIQPLGLIVIIVVVVIVIIDLYCGHQGG